MIAFFSVVPLGKASLRKDVAAVLDVIDGSGVDYRLTAMGTIVEGEADEVWEMIRKCHEEMGKRAERIITHVTIDDRRGARGRIDGKVKDVEEQLGRTLKK